LLEELDAFSNGFGLDGVLLPSPKIIPNKSFEFLLLSCSSDDTKDDSEAKFEKLFI